MRIKLMLAVCVLFVLALGALSGAGNSGNAHYQYSAPPTDSLSEANKPSASGYFAPYPGAPDGASLPDNGS